MAIKFCFLCYKGINSLGNHLRWEHPTVSLQNYYDKFFKKENDGICLNCGKETEFNQSKIRYNTYCCNKCMKTSDVYKQRCSTGVKQVWKLRTNEERTEIGQKTLKKNNENPNIIEVRKHMNTYIFKNKTEQEIKDIKNKRLISLSKSWKEKTPEEIHEILHKRSHSIVHKYTYKNLDFHSFDEMAFYIYNVECLHEKIIRNNLDFYFNYDYDNSVVSYYPDFKINEKYIEIKGLQFFENKNPNGKMICPYHKKEDTPETIAWRNGKCEAKHQCMINNNVEIITDTDKYKQYVITKYGKVKRID